MFILFGFFVVVFLFVCLFLVRSNLLISFLFLFVFLGLHPWHMEVPRLQVKLEPLPLAYATAAAMPDLSCICDLPLQLVAMKHP